MSKTARDYPVTFPYGATGAPYSKQRPHLGDDRAMPVGTPVVVNGVQIGLSGGKKGAPGSGWSTGPHLHVGKWLGGSPHNPNHQGFNFKSAVVTQVSSDDVNGNFVRVQGDGFSWVYLHLSRQSVKAGQKLQVKAPVPVPVLRQFYVVKRGDTVDSISRKYKLDTKNNYRGFRKLNPSIKNINWIYPGQKVRVK